MIEETADVIVLGAGFGGSLTALVLSRLGLRPLLVERGTHPRFAIGESSTPLANLVLEKLARDYSLPRLLPLATYGGWQAACPELRAGLKRGFSYFYHEPDRDFVGQADHGNELLVEASLGPEDADTHWFRADIDHFLVRECQALGIPYLDRTQIVHLDHQAEWTLTGYRDEETCRLRARFLIDASGDGGLIARALGISREPVSLATNSRAVFAHFAGLPKWRDLLEARGVAVGEHPFGCDDAALHHCFAGGWMWVLPFNHGVTSVGFTLDNVRHPLRSDWTPQAEWDHWLHRLPGVGAHLADARRTSDLGSLVRTPRLQRRAARIVGPTWAMLPGTACFFDPLHSTGNAHTLFGIERLGRLIATHGLGPNLPAALGEYEAAIAAEIDLLDMILHGSYQTLGRFELFTAFSMLYFAAATVSEHRRRETPRGPHAAFLLADDGPFMRKARILYQAACAAAAEPAHGPTTAAFRSLVARELAPFDLCGLCDPGRRNLYPFPLPTA